MAYFQFKNEQFLQADMQEVWHFISSPENLKRITPPAMGFDITTKPNTSKMYEGMIIGYIVKPIFGIKTKWVTEITHVKDLAYFVDEQRVGPYKMWHHEHFIEPRGDGVLMKDIVTYAPPFGILGSIANQLFIKKKLQTIFEFRKVSLEKIFNK